MTVISQLASFHLIVLSQDIELENKKNYGEWRQEKGKKFLPWRPTSLSVAVINTTTKSTLGRRGLIWLLVTVPHLGKPVQEPQSWNHGGPQLLASLWLAH